MSAVLDAKGYRCEIRECDQPATYRVQAFNWPAKHLCEDHAAQAKRVGMTVEEIK